MYFKTLEGFLEAGPQMALQLSLLFRGNGTQSSQLVLNPIFGPDDSAVVNIDNLEVLGRVYDEGNNSALREKCYTNPNFNDCGLGVWRHTAQLKTMSVMSGEEPMESNSYQP